MCSRQPAEVVKNTNPENENQGQGRQGDRYRGSFKERDNYQRQGGWDRNQQGQDHREQRQYSNTAAASGQKYGKSGPKFNKRGSSDESCGEDTPHFSHLESAMNMVVDLIWDHDSELNMELDGGKMPVFTF